MNADSIRIVTFDYLLQMFFFLSLEMYWIESMVKISWRIKSLPK